MADLRLDIEWVDGDSKEEHLAWKLKRIGEMNEHIEAYTEMRDESVASAKRLFEETPGDPVTGGGMKIRWKKGGIVKDWDKDKIWKIIPSTVQGVYFNISPKVKALNKLLLTDSQFKTLCEIDKAYKEHQNEDVIVIEKIKDNPS
jgi:hypothetical protein